MTAYKIGQNDHQIEEGRLFVELGTLTILLATPVLPTRFFSGHTFSRLKEKGLLNPVDLKSEKWVQPHICKSVRLAMAA